MAKKTKTWKIGEYAKGGIITIEITGNQLAIIGKEWDHSKGTRKSSDQSNAKEWCRTNVLLDLNDAHHKIFMELTDITTPYYADQIIEWIKENSILEKKF